MSKHDERHYARWPERGGTAVLLPDAPAIYGGRPFADDLNAAERRWAEAFGAPARAAAGTVETPKVRT